MKALRKIWGIRLPLVIIVAALFIYAFDFAGPTLLIWKVKQAVRQDPTMAIVPAPLSDTSISAGQGSTLTRFGYQFELPWQSKEIKRAESIAIFVSESNDQTLLFFDPAKKPSALKIIKEAPASRLPELIQIYGQKALESDYEFDRAMLSASPTQLSYVSPSRRQIGLATLLMMKTTETMNAETGIYSFQWGHLRGFQNGDPERAKAVRVKAFDDQDRQFEFIFGNRMYRRGWLKQSEINRVLQTLRPAAASNQ